MKSHAASMYEALVADPGRMDAGLQVRITQWAVRHSRMEILAALAQRGDLDGAVLDMMITIKDIMVTIALLRRPGRIDAVWPTLREETRVPVLAAAAERDDAPAWVYRRCVAEGNTTVVECLVVNQRVPAAIRKEAAVKLAAVTFDTVPAPRRLEWLDPLLVQHPDIAESLVTADVETGVAVQAATVGGVSLSSETLVALIDRLGAQLDRQVTIVAESGMGDPAIPRAARSVLGQMGELAIAGPLTSEMITRIGDLAETARDRLDGVTDIGGRALLTLELNGVAAAVQTGLAQQAGFAAARLRRCATPDELRQCLDEMMSKPVWSHSSRRAKLGTAALAAPGCTQDLAIRIVDGTPRFMLPGRATIEALVNLHSDAGRTQLATALVLLLTDPNEQSGQNDEMMKRLNARLGQSRPSLTDAAMRLHREEGRFDDLWHWARNGHMSPDVVSCFPVRFLSRFRWSPQAIKSLSEYLNERFGTSPLRWDWFEAMLERPFHGTIAELADAAVRMDQLRKRPERHCS